MVDSYPREHIGGDLMAAEAEEIVLGEEVQFVDIGLEREVAGAKVGFVAIGVGGPYFAEGDVGQQRKMLRQIVFKTDPTGKVSLLGSVRGRLEIADVVGETAKDVDIPLGLGHERKEEHYKKESFHPIGRI